MKRSLIFIVMLAAPMMVFGMRGLYRGVIYEHIKAREKMFEDKYLQVLGLTLWDSSLQDAQKKIGRTPIQEQAYNSGRVSSQACYAGRSSILQFTSPEAKSKGEAVQHFQNIIVTSDKHIEELYAPCTMNPKMENLTFFNGLKLGMTRQEVEKIWGPAGLETPKVMIYCIRRIQQRYFTDDISLYLEFKNGKMTLARMARLAID